MTITIKEEYKALPVDLIERGRFQPRESFTPEVLASLAQSIRLDGIVQPVVVRPLPSTTTAVRYELVAGERRWRAAIQAGMTAIPAVIRHDLSDLQVARIALVENLQREDLNPIEMAFAMKRLIDEFGLTREQVATELGKTKDTVAHYLRLLDTAPQVQQKLISLELSYGHGRVLAGFDRATQIKLVDLAVNLRLSVHQLERYGKNEGSKPKNKSNRQMEGDLREIEQRMSGVLGVRIRFQKKTKDMWRFSAEGPLDGLESAILQKLPGYHDDGQH